MRIVLKTLFWGALGLALIGVVAPAAIGWILAQRFDRVVAHLAIPGTLEVVRRDFERGWFHSHAQVVLRPIGALCHAQPCPVLTLDSRIDQGPLTWGARQTRLQAVLAVVHTKADLTELWPRYVFSPKPPLLTLTSRIALDSRGQARLSLAGTRFDVARGQPIAHVETAAIDGRLDSDRLARHIDGLHLVWPSFSLVRENGGHIGWRKLAFKASSDQYRVLGRQKLTAQSLTLDNGQGRATRLNDLRWESQTQPNDQTALSLRVGQWVLPDNTQGTLIFKGVQRGLVARAWAALPARWQQLGGMPRALDRPVLYRRVLPGLFDGAARLHIDRLELATENGALKTSGDLMVPPTLAATDNAVDFLRQLRLDTHISLPASIVRRVMAHFCPVDVTESEIDAYIDTLTTQDLIEPQDNGQRYDMRIEIDDERVRINGRPRPEWPMLIERLRQSSRSRLSRPSEPGIGSS